jgi:uracil-DNA glycosylase
MVEAFSPNEIASIASKLLLTVGKLCASFLLFTIRISTKKNDGRHQFFPGGQHLLF